MKITVFLLDDDEVLVDTMHIEDIEKYDFEKAGARGVVSSRIIAFIQDGVEG